MATYVKRPSPETFRVGDRGTAGCAETCDGKWSVYSSGGVYGSYDTKAEAVRVAGEINRERDAARSEVRQWADRRWTEIKSLPVPSIRLPGPDESAVSFFIPSPGHDTDWAESVLATVGFGHDDDYRINDLRDESGAVIQATARRYTAPYYGPDNEDGGGLNIHVYRLHHLSGHTCDTPPTRLMWDWTTLSWCPTNWVPSE